MKTHKNKSYLYKTTTFAISPNWTDFSQADYNFLQTFFFKSEHRLRLLHHLPVLLSPLQQLRHPQLLPPRKLLADSLNRLESSAVPSQSRAPGLGLSSLENQKILLSRYDIRISRRNSNWLSCPSEVEFSACKQTISDEYGFKYI